MAIMSRISILGSLVVLGTVGGACSSSSSSSLPTDLTVRDTLDKVYTVAYPSYGGLSPKDANLKPISCENEYGATEQFVLVSLSQILQVHAVLVPSYGYISFNPAEPGRPIACTTDADCAPGLYNPAYTCQNNLCQYVSADNPMQTLDVIALCQADLPWPTSCPSITDPKFARRMVEVADACGSATNCSNVPADCRQLVPPVAQSDASVPQNPIESPIDGSTGEIDSM